MALHVYLAGLEIEGWQRLGKVRHVLPGAAANLEHEAAWRQYAGEHIEDRLLIALGGWGGLACVRSAALRPAIDRRCAESAATPGFLRALR